MRRLVLPLVDDAAPHLRLGSTVVLPDATGGKPLETWVAAVARSHGPCLLVDAAGAVFAISTSALHLLGESHEAIVGRKISDVLPLIDFHTGAATTEYAARIPPLAALAGTHSRSIIRIAGPGGSVTLDALAAPVYAADGSVAGSVNFLSTIGHG